MRPLLFLAICQFVSFDAFCQTDSISISILETILRKEHPGGTLFYTDKLDGSLIDRIKESVKGRKFIGRTSPTTYATIYLSKAEKKYLDSSVRMENT